MIDEAAKASLAGNLQAADRILKEAVRKLKKGGELMADNTKIEWADATLNAVRARRPDGVKGSYCEKVSEGCRFCYSERMNIRLVPGRIKPGFLNSGRI